MIAFVLHGGAGARRSENYDRELAHMKSLVDRAYQDLFEGACALDVVVEIVGVMEASGLYVAGRGASPNSVGDYELDAAVMDGFQGGAGAVGALMGFRSPIAVARAVMERTPHVLLVGEGAARFAVTNEFASISDPQHWFIPAALHEANYATGKDHGTVGCVALDDAGRLAAATSTGGVFGKLPGRIGDTPLIGCGCWADREIAIVATGQGDYFIRCAAAAQVSFRYQFGNSSLAKAAEMVLAEISRHGGEGGFVAISRSGDIVTPFNCEGMKWGARDHRRSGVVGVFEPLGGRL